jgi:hypothetical protein
LYCEPLLERSVFSESGRFHDVGDIRLDDVEELKIQEPSNAIIRLTSSAICGTDLHMVRALWPGCNRAPSWATRVLAWSTRSVPIPGDSTSAIGSSSAPHDHYTIPQLHPIALLYIVMYEV